MKHYLHSLMAVFFFISIPHFSFSEKSNITILVSNIPTTQGRIMVALQRGLFYAMEPVNNSSIVKIDLKRVPNGKYLLSVFHDENCNWRLDMQNKTPLESCANKEIVVTDDNRVFNIELSQFFR